jgi:hypothetical protein
MRRPQGTLFKSAEQPVWFHGHHATFVPLPAAALG